MSRICSLGLVLLGTESNCKWARYRDAGSVYWHSTTSDCLVIYRQPESKSWYEAATHCMKRGAHIAVFDTITSTDVVSFFPVAALNKRCTWIGLVKKFFYWNIIQRTLRYV